MKKYFDNLLFHLQRSGGGSVHWGELMKRFNNRDDVAFIEPKGHCDNIIKNEINLKEAIKESALPTGILRYVPLTVKLDTPSIFHSSYYRYSLQKDVVNFTTVHDFIYEKFGKGLPKFVHHLQKGLAVKKADKIICVSNTTKSDLLQYFPFTNKKDIAVIYNGVSELFRILDKGQVDEQFLMPEPEKWVLYVGHRTSYKNFDFAANVVAALPPNYKLVIVGNRLSPAEDAFLQKTLSNRFKFFGNVTNEQLNQLYNTVECLLYPSNYEGFGIPLIEAFKCKCPVVAQNTAIVKEIAGSSALISALTLQGFTNNILSLQDIHLRHDITASGLEAARSYSWDKCFKETNDFYDTI